MICSWFCGLCLECEDRFLGFPGFVICARISVICVFLKNQIPVICGWFWNFWEDFGDLWLGFVPQGWFYEQVCWFVAAFL